MKQILLIAVAVFAINLPSVAGTAEKFSYSKTEVENSMAHLDRLEEFVVSNPGITYAEIAATQGDLIASVSDISVMSINTDGEDNSALGVPSFLWGCCLGWVGILIVYLVSEDTEETKKALWGCLASCVAWGAVYLVYWVVYVGTFYTYY